MSRPEDLPLRREMLARDRREVSFVGTAEPQPTTASKFREIFYPDRIVSTIYLNPSTNPLTNGYVRLRFRSRNRFSGESFMFSPQQKAILEIKFTSNDDTGSGERSTKISVPDVPLLDTVAVLRDPKQYDFLDQFPDGEAAKQALQDLLQGEGLKPYLMIESERRHFERTDEPVRVTVDRATSYWGLRRHKSVFYTSNLLFGIKATTEEKNTVEIKKPVDYGTDTAFDAQILQDLFGANHDYEPAQNQKKTIAKRLLMELGGLPQIVNVENVESERGYDVVEREDKIDLGEDPRPLVEALPKNVAPSIVLGPSNPYIVYLRYLQINPTTVVAEKSFTPDFAISGFQHKIPIQQGDTIVRREKTFFSLDELLTALDQEREAETIKQSPTGKRDRVERIALSTETGNLFSILGDHCTADDNRPPLEQIEIEYLGKLLFPNAVPGEPEIDSINRDFQKIKSGITTLLQERNVTILPTQTTKEQWLTT